MNTFLKLMAIFLACRLAWTWLDQCGFDLGLGDALPFCIECSGFATLVRLMILGLGVWFISRTLRQPQTVDPFPQADPVAGKTHVMQWHRILLLAGIVTYPLWVWWIDSNTAIPGPQDNPLSNLICSHPDFKGTLIWGIVVAFLTIGFRIVYLKRLF